jgi:hypothetical protein
VQQKALVPRTHPWPTPRIQGLQQTENKMTCSPHGGGQALRDSRPTEFLPAAHTLGTSVAPQKVDSPRESLSSPPLQSMSREEGWVSLSSPQ